MALSIDLISQFAKITKPETKTKSETTIYGTIKEYSGTNYIKLDGSDLLTPIPAASTVDVRPEDRVMVLLKNHVATITGNITSPAVRTETVTVITNTVEGIQEVLADTVTTDELKVEQARITELEADNVEVSKQLTANSADIQTLRASDVTITGRLDAAEASIQTLSAGQLDVETLKATFATIAQLDATNADVGELEADVGDINTLIFGSATGTTIQTSFANAVIAQLGDAQIKSAMIESVSAGKITAGDIITNNVRVLSESGALLISEETIQINDGTRTRVQIGRDASNDYSINIWDADGKLMFSEGGLTDDGIKEAIIRNDMVSDTANIAAHKLDIDSLFEEINGSTNTIKSTKVYLDDEKQTLDVAFKALSTTVTDQGTTITSHGTDISTIQGQISSKIWQQDINTATTAMSTQYSTLNQDLSSFKSTVGETYATKTDVDSIDIGGRNLVLGTSDSWTDIKVPRHAATVGGRRHCSYYGLQVGDEITYSLELNPLTKTALRARLDFYSDASSEDGKTPNFGNDISNGQPGRSHLTTTIPEGCEYIALMIANANNNTETDDSIEQYRRVKLERGNQSTDWTPAPEDLETRVSDAETAISQNTEAISLSATKTATDIATAKSEAIAAASSDATTKANKALSDANANTADLLTNYSTTTQMNAAIDLKASGITSAVSETYVSKTAFNNLEIGGRNLLDDAQIDQPTLKEGGTFTYTSTAKGTKTFFSGVYLEPGDYVYSLRVKRTQGNDAARIRFFKNGATIGYYSNNRTDGEWGIVKIPFTVTSSEEGYGSQVYNHSFEDEFDPEVSIQYLKIERGDKATDWTPAPEDMATATRMTTVEQTASGLTIRMNEAEGDISDAAKTATNYLKVSTDGLVVGDMTASTLGKNVCIDPDSVDIRNGDTVLASFEAKRVSLGQNAYDSYIDLCDGAGKISLRTSELSTSYPEYNAISLESQEVAIDGQRIVATATNEYDTDTEPAVTRQAQLYMLRSGDSDSVSNVRIEAEHLTNSTNTYVSTGFSALTYDASSSTRALMYAYDSGNKVYNRLDVYTNKATLSKPLYIDGVEFSGSNKVLWSGGYYMSSGQTATLSESVDAQANGIVLIWSYYADGAPNDSSFNTTFIPKYFVSAHTGKGVASLLVSGSLAMLANKYVYISNTTITGYALNNASATEKDPGVISTSKAFVLRYVIGV